MHLIKYPGLFFALLLCCITYSDSKAGVAEDTTYVKTFPNQVTGRIFLGEKISIFRMIDKDHGQAILYRPNNVLSLGAGVTIFGIGLNFSTKLPFHDRKEDQYGHTRGYDVQVHKYSRKLALDVYLQQYRGFHISNKEDVVTSVNGPTEFPYFPQLRTLTFGGSAMYILRGERFSLRAPVNQQEWQVKSSGSLMFGGSLFSHFIYNDSSLLPAHLKLNDFYDGLSPKSIRDYGVTIDAGYGYTYVYKRHYFASGTLGGGVGIGYTQAKDIHGVEKSHFDPQLTSDIKLSAGYNSNKWFGGFYFIYHTDRFNPPYDNTVVGTSQGIFRIVVARRFQTTKLGSSRKLL